MNSELRAIVTASIVGLTLVFGIYAFFNGRLTLAQQRVFSEQRTVATLQQTLEANRKLLELEPGATQQLAKYAKPLTPNAIVKEHQAVSTCTHNSGTDLTAYNVSNKGGSIAVTEVGKQNNLLSFLDCLDSVDFPIDTQSLTLTMKNTGLELVLNGVLVANE